MARLEAWTDTDRLNFQKSWLQLARNNLILGEWVRSRGQKTSRDLSRKKSQQVGLFASFRHCETQGPAYFGGKEDRGENISSWPGVE